MNNTNTNTVNITLTIDEINDIDCIARTLGADEAFDIDTSGDVPRLRIVRIVVCHG